MPVTRSFTALASVAALAFAGSAATTRYTVRGGDTLSAVAMRTSRSVGELAAANRIADPDRIYAGQVLTVPDRPQHTLPVRLIASPQRLDLAPVFRRWAGANALPADLLMAVTWLESGWQQDVVSPKGAVGIGQLMPGTAAFVREVLIGAPTLDPAVAEDNIRMSARYLGWLLKRSGGDVRAALGSYYQGPGSMAEHGPFAATVAYVEGVLRLRGGFAGIAVA